MDLKSQEASQDETETDELDNSNLIAQFIPIHKKIASDYKHLPKSDFIFGDGEFDLPFPEYSSTFVDSMDDNAWSLPKEAFPLRHEIQNRSPPPEQFPNHSPDMNEETMSVTNEDQPYQLTVNWTPKPVMFDFYPILKEAIQYHANLGDIQTVISILIVIGDKRKQLNFDTTTEEHWLLEYIELLGRFKLWEVSTKVRLNIVFGFEQ